MRRHADAFVARYYDEDTIQDANRITTRSVLTTNSDTALCWVAKAKTVPPCSKTPVLVQTKEAGTYKFEATTTKSIESRRSVAKNIMKNFSLQLFHNMVANTSSTPVTLPNSMRVATLFENPSKFGPVQEKIVVDPVNTVPIYKKKHTGE